MSHARNDVPDRHSVLLLGAWVSGVPLGIIFSGHGYRFECGRCFSSNVLECMCYTRGFDPVAGFPPAGLLLAVLIS